MYEKNYEALDELCAMIRKAVRSGDIEGCIQPICSAMAEFPDAPHPHNLMGIVLEKLGRHSDAMKHFRASYALDPGYAPATVNLESSGTFYGNGLCAFDESDCQKGKTRTYAVHYDAQGIGRMIRRS